MTPAAPDRRTRRSAFTLVELLVSAGVIGSLVGILLPGVGAARRAARLTQCQANARAIVTAMTEFAATHDGAYPSNSTFPAPGVYWFDPRSAGRGLNDPARSVPGRVGGGALACPDDPEGMISYAQNVWSTGSADTRVAKAPAAVGTGWKAGVERADRMILVAEAWSYAGSAATGYFADPTVGFAGGSAGQRFGGNGGITPVWLGRWDKVNCELPFARHRRRPVPGRHTEPVGRVTLGYADGHVALRADTDLVGPATGRSTGDSAWSTTERP